MRPLALVSLVPLLLATASAGCSKAPPQNETVQGLQEENKVVREQTSDLKHQVAALKAENEAIKASLHADCEDRLAKLRQLHEEKVKQLEATNSTLLLELGAVRKEKLALQELLDQRPRLQEAVQVRFGIERTVWMVFVLAPLGMLLLVSSKYHKLRGQLNQQVVQQAATLRRLGDQR